jgi:dihydrofolate reductase
MRKVVLYELLALDGVAEEPGNWLFEGGDELIANLGRVIDKQDTVLLGRGTYDYWVDFWPTATMEPFASFINGTPKHVFTSREPAGDWAETTFIERSAVDHVEELRQGDGGDIGIHGSISLAQSLLQAELVDELRLVVAPTIAGSGRKLFDGDGGMQRFDLVDADRTKTGLALLWYVKRLAS